MALHPHFPRSPYAVPDPAERWFPANEALRATAYEKLLAPLVAKVRDEVSAWRAAAYPGTSPTSRALLRWWFETPHLGPVYGFVFIDQKGFEAIRPRTFSDLTTGFQEYQ